MKKLLFTVLAVLAFSGASFADGKDVKLKSMDGVNCSDVARGAVWQYYNSGGISIENAVAIKAAALAACKARYNQN